jgi:hypothetical protein
VRGQPGPGEDDRCPPGIAGQDHGAGDPADHLNHAVGNEVHRDRQGRRGHAEVEVSRRGEIAGQRRIFEMSHARRPDAGHGDAVIQPGGRAIAEISAERLVDRREHLQGDEHDAGERQRRGQRFATLDGGDEHAHRHGKQRRQRASQQEGNPPPQREGRGRSRQRTEQLPFFPRRQTLAHRRIVAQVRGGSELALPLDAVCL